MNNSKVHGINLNTIIFNEGFSCDIPNDFYDPKYEYGRFYNGETFNLEYIFFPEEGSINIGERAFCRHPKMSELRISGSVITIGNEAFQELTGLKQLTIGKNVKSIGLEAFAGCDTITDINVEAITPPSIDISTFSETTYIQANLHVPEESIEAYRSAIGWSRFFQVNTVNNITVNKDNEVYHTLQGTCISKPIQKGIYIKDKKKVIITP